MTDAATARYTSFRIALASGLLGAAGATLGWLVWLTARVANRELLVTVLVGALIGLAVHWIQHYIRVARRERDGHSAAEAPAAPGPTIRRRAAFAWAAGFGFLGLVTEHLIADMAAEFLQPFLASIAALLPAGMILGWTMSRGREESNPFAVIYYGIGIGAAIMLVTGLIWKAGFGDVPWFSLFAWWGLIGLGTRIVARGGRQRVRVFDPLLAVGVVFLLLLVLDRMPTDLNAYNILGIYKGGPAMLRAMALQVHESPALPATFWEAAEQRFHDKEAGDACPVPIWAKKPVPVATVTAIEDSIADKLIGDPVKAAVARAARPPDTTITVALPEPPKIGAETEFLRSWLVIILFAAGLGVAPWLELRLRPIDYPNSETYRRDITLSVVVVLMVVGACVFARIDQRKAAARDEACRMEWLNKENQQR